MARKKKLVSASTSNAGDVITSIKYPAKRKNIHGSAHPVAGLWYVASILLSR
jgi:hypothetical protein